VHNNSDSQVRKPVHQRQQGTVVESLEKVQMEEDEQEDEEEESKEEGQEEEESEEEEIQQSLVPTPAQHQPLRIKV
jgi:hypothetical protein